MNLRPLRPERSALAKLSYSPAKRFGEYTTFPSLLQVITELLQNSSHNKFTGSISMATLTAGRIGRSARRPANNLCMVAACGAWTMICIL